MGGSEPDAQARALLEACKRAGLMVATAESCTGGMVAAALTEVAGSSAVVDRGFVTYSNGAKTEMLGVPADLIAANGAVSEPVARAMAEGALANSRAELAVSITGVAGPGGGTAEKPVGTVWFACAAKGRATVAVGERFPPGSSRSEIRRWSVDRALDMLLAAAQTRSRD